MDRDTVGFVQRLGSDQRGTVAIIFALVLLPIVGVVSLSIDYGRALKTKSLLNNAAEAALHGIAGSIAMDKDELHKRVRAAMDANLPEDLRGLPFTLAINETARTVNLQTATVIPTAIMSLIGVDRMDVAVSSTVKLPEALPRLDAGPLIAGTPGRIDTQRAAEELARHLQQNEGKLGGGPSGVPGGGAVDLEAARQAMQSPEMQRLSADLEARMREAMAKARR